MPRESLPTSTRRPALSSDPSSRTSSATPLCTPNTPRERPSPPSTSSTPSRDREEPSTVSADDSTTSDPKTGIRKRMLTNHAYLSQEEYTGTKSRVFREQSAFSKRKQRDLATRSVSSWHPALVHGDTRLYSVGTVRRSIQTGRLIPMARLWREGVSIP